MEPAGRKAQQVLNPRTIPLKKYPLQHPPAAWADTHTARGGAGSVWFDFLSTALGLARGSAYSSSTFVGASPFGRPEP